MPPKTARQRADLLLTQRGLAESREQAQTLIMEGLVFSPAGRVLKASSPVAEDTPLEVRGRLPYVGRGGIKLAHALDTFGIDPHGMVALDVGASTGGFTDCLLQRGAARVCAIDVGHGQLHQRLREDPRVFVIEKLNARYPFDLPEAVDLVVIDVSFISLRLIIPPSASHLKAGQPIIALVKPQFEAQRGEVGRNGVIRDPKIHARVQREIAEWAQDQGFTVAGQCPSPIQGDAGNREFFIHLTKPATPNFPVIPAQAGTQTPVAPPNPGVAAG